MPFGFGHPYERFFDDQDGCVRAGSPCDRESVIAGLIDQSWICSGVQQKSADSSFISRRSKHQGR